MASRRVAGAFISIVTVQFGALNNMQRYSHKYAATVNEPIIVPETAGAA